MKAFLALCGLAVGLWLGLFPSVGEGVFAAIVGLLFLWLSFRKSCLSLYLGFLVIGVAFALLGRIPIQGETFTGVVVRSKENYFLLQVGLSRVYVAKKGNPYELFDIVSVNGKVGDIKVNTYESQFDFKEYLRKLGALGMVEQPLCKAEFLFPIRIRGAEQAFLGKLEKNASSLLAASLFNLKDYDAPAIEYASGLSLLFLFSASGFVLGSLLRVIDRLFLKGAKRKNAYLILFLIGLCFTPLSPYKAGVWRVVSLYGLRFFFEMKKKEPSTLFLHSLSGIIVLILDFRFAYDQGFLIGFGLCFLFDFSLPVFQRIRKNLLPIARLVFLRVFLLPVSLSSGQGFALFSLPFSLLLTPFTFLFSFLGLIGFLGIPMEALLNPYGDFLYETLALMSRINPILPLPALSYLGVGLFLLCLLLFLIGKEIGVKRIYRGALVSFLSIYSISLVPIVPFFTQEVTFINVGQGDAALIRDGLHAVLIDTGGRKDVDLARQSLIPLLRRKRIYRLDAVIASHHDFDHIGAKDSLLQNFDVGRFIDDPSDFPLTIGGLTFQNHNVYSWGEENEDSLVLSFSLLGETFLFTGDAGVAVEKRIIEDNPGLRCTILKVGHHGSKTSTSSEFLQTLKPREAIVSVGAKNTYGHPDPGVMGRLKNAGIRIRRTDEEGSICYMKPKLSDFGF